MARAPITLMSEAPTSRLMRSPTHRFMLRQRPFQIVPFMCAPVLPSETLENIWFESRVVSDPVASTILGAKAEYHFFYVKIRDIANYQGMATGQGDSAGNDFEQIFIDPIAADLSGWTGGYAGYYQDNDGVDWLRMATDCIVKHHFRDTDEAAPGTGAAGELGNYYLAQVREQGWMDSLSDDEDVPVGADPGTATTADQLQELMDQFEALQAIGWSAMTFEDYLGTHGISIPRNTLHRPERLCSFSKFVYPSNTIDPSDGSAVGAWSWSFKEMKRDRKSFQEPGFIVGLHIVRPKVYFGNQAGALHGYLDKGLYWLPAILKDNPHLSLRKFADAADSGPVNTTGAAGDYWVDMRDLFNHGDQFINFTPDATSPVAALPAVHSTTKLQSRYISSADADAYFAGASPANQIRQDGFCSVHIKGWQRDYTKGQLGGSLG